MSASINTDHTLFNILHHGAVNGVTGSCHQLQLTNNHSESYSVLIDCGLFQGDEKEGSSALDDDTSDLAQKQIDFSLDGISVLVVTHCHIDHVGRIPYLLAAGFDGPIYATQATAHLLPLVIEDALKVGVTRNQRLIRSVLNKLKALLKPMPYDQWFDLDGMSNCKARFQVAGHILGSAYVEFDILDVSDVKNEGSHRVVFSGDLGAPHSPLLSAPKSTVRVDTLVIESTYGDKLHETREHRRQRLKQAIERSFEDGGTVLIPAFSIGRTQELLYEIEEIIHVIESAKKLNKLDENTVSKGATVWDHLDIIIDSPLAAKFTQSYRELKIYGMLKPV
jgi:metallo-beta-lactamase family protein